jgi:hypothetical protein
MGETGELTRIQDPRGDSRPEISFFDSPAQIFSNRWVGIARILSSMFPSWAEREIGERLPRKRPTLPMARALIGADEHQ